MRTYRFSIEKSRVRKPIRMVSGDDDGDEQEVEFNYLTRT